MKKKILFFIIGIILSFIASLLFEIIIVNHEVISKKSINNPTIIESSNMNLVDGKYVTNSGDSYIVIKVDEGYINKIEFDYNYNKNFSWQCSYKQNNEEINIGKSSLGIINKSVKKIDKNIDEIKLSFNDENIKIYNIRINNDIFIYWYRVIGLTIVLSVLLVLFVLRKKLKEYKIHNIFAVIAILLGVALILVSPKNVYTSFDDQIHFAHSLNPFKQEKIKYSYSEQMVVSGSVSNNPSCETKEEKLELYKSLNKLHDQTKNRVVDVSNERSLYGNIVYLPFYVGYKLSNFLNFNFVTCFMMGKLFNLLLYTLFFYLAIKYAKYGKKVIFMIGLIPECLFFTTQYTYDGTINAGIILATVCFINLISEEKINKKYIMLFILSTLWASLPKALYGIFLLLLLFIPSKKFNNKKQAYLFKITVLLITSLVLITFVLPTITGTMSADTRGGDTSVSGQLEYILKNPIDFIKTLTTFTITKGWKYSLGYRNFIYVPYISDIGIIKYSYYIYLLTLFYYAFTSKISSKFTFKYKSLFVLEIIGIWLLFCAALYLKFTNVGSNSISGIQARYMLPLFAAFFYLFLSKKKKEDNNNDYLYIFIPILFVGLLVLFISTKAV